jgi:hypothetical protein
VNQNAGFGPVGAFCGAGGKNRAAGPPVSYCLLATQPVLEQDHRHIFKEVWQHLLQRGERVAGFGGYQQKGRTEGLYGRHRNFAVGL